MAEQINIPLHIPKEQKYELLLPQISSLIESETDLIANLANISAVLKEVFNFFWVGFYLVRENELVLGPFQGPLACTRIRFGKGVCGCAWESAEAIIVPDVDKFTGHIACSSLSKSEIVVPLFNDGNVVGVLDVDSDTYDRFDNVDKLYLTNIVSMIKF